MTKILTVSELWWPDGTGGILASHLIAKYLRNIGFGLTVVHGTRKPATVDGINYVYTSLLSARSKHRLWINCSILARKAWFLKALRECDIVYIPRYCYPIIPVAKKLDKRVIVHLHDYQPVSYNSVILSDSLASYEINVAGFEVLERGSILRALVAAYTSPMNRLCRIWLKEADVIICVSKRQAEIIGRLAPELADELRVIYNPLPDIPFVEKNLGNPTFLYLGGDSYVKGFHVFLGASMKILRMGYSTKFLIAGMVRMEGNRSIINVLNRKYRKVYRLLGHIPHGEVLKLHSTSYALLFPSICEEPFPYAVVESMAAGTLPIASRVGGVPEIIRGAFAERLMYMPGNVDELAERMEYVLSMNVEQLKSIGLSLREALLRRFNQESIRKELVKVFLG